MTAPARVVANDSTKTSAAATSTITPTWVQATVLGNYLVMIVAHYASADNTATISTPTGWTLATSTLDPSGNCIVAYFYRANSAVRSGNESVVNVTPAAVSAAYMGEYANVVTTTPVDVAVHNEGGTTALPPVSAGTVAPAQAGELVIGALVKRNSTETLSIDTTNSVGTWAQIVELPTPNATASSNVRLLVAECFPRGRQSVELNGTWTPTSQTRSFAGLAVSAKGTDRSVAQAAAGSVAPSGAFARAIGRLAAGAVAPVGVLKRGMSRVMSGSVTPSGALTMLKAKLFGGSVTPAAGLQLTVGKLASGSAAPSGALGKALARFCAGSVTPTGVTRKSLARLLVGAVTPLGAPLRAVGRVLAGSVAPSGALAVQRAVGKLVGGSVTPSGAVAQRAVARALAGSVTPTSGVLRKVVLRPVGGAVAPVGALGRGVAKLLLGAVTPAGAVLRVWAKAAFTGAVTPSGAVQKLVAKVLHVPYWALPRLDGASWHWRMSEAASPLVDTISGVAMPVTGAPTYRAPGALYGPDDDKAVLWAGTGSAQAASPLASGLTQFTIEGLFYLDPADAGSSTNRALWCGLVPTTDARILTRGSGLIYFGVGTGAVELTLTPTIAAGLVGAWHHVAMVRNGATLTAYVDGVQVAQRTDLAAGGTRIAGGPGVVYPYLGTLDELAVYQVALSGAQVAAHAAAWGSPSGGYVRPAGAVARRVSRTIAGAVTPVGALGSVTLRVIQLALAGAITPVSALGKLVAKRVTGSASPSGSVQRTAKKTYAGAVTPAGTLKRGAAKALGGALSPVGALVRRAQLAMRGSATPSGSVQASGVDTGPGLDAMFDPVPPDEVTDESFDTREPEAVP